MFDRVSDLFISPIARSGHLRRKPRVPQFEFLESRQVMAANLTASLGSDRVLRVEGTPAADTINIRYDGTKLSVDGVQIQTSSGAQASVSRSLVGSIEVLALGGDDYVKMNEWGFRSLIGMTVYGGLGNDTIHGSEDRDFLYGGDSHDSLGWGDAAADLDRQYGFYLKDSEYFNWTGGLNEKWMMSASGVWHYVTPDGVIRRYDANRTPVGTVHQKFYQNLSELYEADSGSEAAEADRQHGLYSTGNLWQNWYGKNEKWVMGSSQNKWFYITPDGTLYQQGTNASDGKFITKLDVSYWTDINKLVNAATLLGNSDVIYSYGGNDVLRGGGDRDFLYGGAFDDEILGGLGADRIYGESGADRLFGNRGGDFIYGGDHNDTIYGSHGNDTLLGDGGLDEIWGGDFQNGNDYGNEDSDYIRGGIDNDELHGGGGLFDSIFGDDGDDVLWGDTGVDYLYGGNHNDRLYGGAGLDSLYGENGNDGLFGGWADGKDSLDGGTGADRYLQPEWQRNLAAVYEDQISDFDTLNATVYFNQAEKAWTDAEVIDVDRGLHWLHSRVNNTRLLKLQNGNAITFNRATTFDDRLGDNMQDGNIRLYDGAWNADPIEQTVVHEVAHNWDTGFHMLYFNAISGWEKWDTGQVIPASKWPGTGSAWKEGGTTYRWIYNGSARFVEDYARTNPREDFASSLEGYFALTTATPMTAAASQWQEKWNLINGWLNGLTT